MPGAMNPKRLPIRDGKHANSLALAAIALLVCVLVFLALWRRQPASAHEQERAELHLISSSFVNGGAIPRRFACDGAGDSPSLEWAKGPYGTRSFAIVMNDPDAPIDFTHWLVYNIPASVRGLVEGASGHGALPQGSEEGTNSFRRAGYGAPCPPPGKPHHYVFRIFAINTRIDLPPGASRAHLESAIRDQVLAEGQIVGIYGRATE